MDIEYGSNKLQKQLSNTSEMKKAFGVNATRVSQRLDDIAAAPNLAVLMQIPAANCHPLIGNRRGEWSVDVCANQRLIFRIDHVPIPTLKDGSTDRTKVTAIRITETTDYH